MVYAGPNFSKNVCGNELSKVVNVSPLKVATRVLRGRFGGIIIAMIQI